ncbi:hypothetical protein GY45DRAFT_1264816 [Cubamyces sp. BRFM 1775]|nr:hypothetical protein GY45DRAFT_1264816 [Cubamyces sp. BRFM 1775]
MTSFIPPPPPGLNYIAVIEPLLDLLLIDTILSSFLVPTLITLFYFSTSSSRRQPMFVMNILAIACAIALAIINICNQTRAILAKPVSPAMDTALLFMTIFAPFCAEFVLVFRVVAVHPPSIMSWPARILVYFPVASFKTARVVNIIIFIVQWVQRKQHLDNPLLRGQAAWSLPNIKIEWVLQFLDMTFVSALFLARLRRSTRAKREAGIHSSSEAATGAFSSRLRTLFWIAASNLVIPVLLILVQLVYIFRDSNFLHGTYVFFINIYVQIIGVLLATIWSTGTRQNLGRTADGNAADTGTGGHSSIRWAPQRSSALVTRDTQFAVDVELGGGTGRSSLLSSCSISVEELRSLAEVVQDPEGHNRIQELIKRMEKEPEKHADFGRETLVDSPI